MYFYIPVFVVSVYNVVCKTVQFWLKKCKVWMKGNFILNAEQSNVTYK